jgi:hypothetical protein
MTAEYVMGKRSGNGFYRMRKNKSVKADLLLVAVLILVGIAIAGALLLTRHTGAVVTVSVDGRVVERFPLTENRRYEITGAEGGYNRLVIEDGQAWIQEADCPDALCVHMGKIRYAGQSVVCLPHRVVVRIEDSPDGMPDGVDVVTG